MSDQTIFVHTKQSWPEDLADENGDYLNRCIFCGCTFQGHKRRVVCRLCAPPTTAATQQSAPVFGNKEKP